MKILNIMFLGLMLMLAVSFPVFAGENNVSKLIVQGEGKVSATPDMATIILGVETLCQRFWSSCGKCPADERDNNVFAVGRNC